MQFRPHGKKLYLLRSIYSPELKKSKNTVIAKLDIDTTRLPREITATLTPEEKKQWSAFLRTHKANLALAVRHEALSKADSFLPHILPAYRSGHLSTETSALIDAFLASAASSGTGAIGAITDFLFLPYRPTTVKPLYTFVIDADPRRYQRPGKAHRGGKSWIYDNNKKYRKLVRDAFLAAFPDAAPVETTALVRYTYVLPTPTGAAWPEARQEATLRGEVEPNTPYQSPDFDNLVKVVQDALRAKRKKIKRKTYKLVEPGFWFDDAQICSASESKLYTTNPGVLPDLADHFFMTTEEAESVLTKPCTVVQVWEGALALRAEKGDNREL